MSKIFVELLHEAGYEQALLGLAKSFNAEPENMPDRALKLAHRGPGHNKFLESIIVWLDVDAPRYWWQEADTYRLSTKQSESTMHTILKRPLVQDDFAAQIPEEYLSTLNEADKSKDLAKIKAMLPEGFMQSRLWCLSYKTLQNIYVQRHDHKLWEWREFLNQVCRIVAHPEFLVDINKDLKRDVDTAGP